MFEEIKKTSPIRRELNKSDMVRWINNDLISRAHHYVRRPFVYYDANHDFVLALENEPKSLSESTVADLEKLGVKYYSKGIV